MKQEVRYINISDLVLWTENPRDPISSSATDQDIADRALAKGAENWKLPSLAKQMGAFLDLSETPTVVFHGDKPVVYDGNRRVLLGKIYFGLVRVDKEFPVPEYPEKIPCNVCDKETALANVLRKHAGSGSWKPLERDIFLHKFMREPKSAFLQFEDETNAVTKFPELNKGYIKDEIFNKVGFEKLGFKQQDDGRFQSMHGSDEVQSIIRDIASKVKSGDMTTRKNRGNFFEALEPDTRRLIDENKARNNFRPVSFERSKSKVQIDPPPPKMRSLTPRKKSKDEFFGGKLYLKRGAVNDIYRDITDLNNYYSSRKNSLTEGFPNLIKMSLRLLCETAAKDLDKGKFDKYLEVFFEQAKSKLSKDQKTTLSTYSVNSKSIVQLLHTGAHSYSSSADYKQAVALSIIIGEILKLSHGKE